MSKRLECSNVVARQIYELTKSYW